MKKTQQKVFDFFKTPAGVVVVFVVIFYVMTFLVYYFYSPGPEERRQAGIGQQVISQEMVRQAQQDSKITITRN
jgi:flagellar biosynthesis/type III secretory pathway M-ring protein FliF/YscJ